MSRIGRDCLQTGCRFSKDEVTKCIKVDKGAQLLGEFTPVVCPVLRIDDEAYERLLNHYNI